MALNLSHWVIVRGALVFGIIAIALGPLREFITRKSLHFGFNPPSALLPQPAVIDVERDITYIGSYVSGVEHFQNIFYAEDTSGHNRFHAPVPTKPRRGSTIDATQSGAWCPQGTGDIFPFTSPVTNISENCLSLKIARPVDTKKDAGLPVLVWLHGGGHALGSGSDVLYTPDGLVKEAVALRQPVLWVAINYRLGFFGFATSTIIKESKQANMGLRDQRAAFEWIQENIGNFGGDPQRVTAIGQSVGASDISLQMTAFGGASSPLFQQAILMSGGPGVNFNTESNIVTENTAAVAREVGCVKDDSQNLQTLECLRRVPFEVLTNVSVTAARAARPPFGEGFFFPTLDGDFIQKRPSELVREGKITKGVPILASWVANDGAWYPPPTTSTDEQVLASFGLWLRGLSTSTNEKLLELYPVKDFEHMVRLGYDGPVSPQYYRAAQLNRDLWFTCPVLDFAWQYVRTGGVHPSKMHLSEHNATRFTPVFEGMGVPMWRVSHLSDIPYVLNIQHLSGGADNSKAQLQLAARLSRDIIRFATSGDPNEEGDDQSWPPAFTKATEEELREPVYPKSFVIRLFGGPFRTGPVTVSRKINREGDSFAEEAIQWEKLIERCEFINSGPIRKEIGV